MGKELASPISTRMTAAVLTPTPGIEVRTLNVDLLEAATGKVAANDQRYTVERSMGSARKVD